jgi:hypothetical protein
MAQQKGGRRSKEIMLWALSLIHLDSYFG